MGIFPTLKEVNENQNQIINISPFSQAPLGHYEEMMNFIGTGSANQLYTASQAIQCATMVPFYMQEQWRPTSIEWVVSAAQTIGVNTTSIAYNWIITDENGKVVGTTPIVSNTALVVGVNIQTITLSATTFKPGTYYYGFAYSDNTTTSSTTSITHYSLSTAAKARITGCKMWTYQGTGAQLPSSMVNGASCTLSIPTLNTIWGIIQSSIRCIS